MKIVQIALFLLIAGLAALMAEAGEISSNEADGSLTLAVDGAGYRYEDIIGEYEGFDRWFTTINGAPALVVLGRDSYYYTLEIVGKEIRVDCSYVDARNSQNGAGVLAGSCGLGIPLESSYSLIGQSLANEWKEKIFNFEIVDFSGTKGRGDYFLGKIGEVEVYDRYASFSDVENSSPVRYIKTNKGCHFFHQAKVFLVFSKKLGSLSRLDVLKSEEPLTFYGLSEVELNAAVSESCE